MKKLFFLPRQRCELLQSIYKERGMSTGHSLLRTFKTIGMALTLGVSMSACAINTFTWKEEVLLHDGSKIIVKRSQKHGGRGEIGQSPIKEHDISFTIPGSSKSVTWKDEYSEDVGHSNFDLLALHVLNGAPYVVASPYGSLAYNKWDRPNPPYVFFKFNGKVWQRIQITEFPLEFKEINLVINASAHEKKLVNKGLVPAEMVRQLNSSLTQEEYKSIHRTPLDHWKSRPEHKGPKAPQPITPPTTIDGK